MHTERVQGYNWRTQLGKPPTSLSTAPHHGFDDQHSSQGHRQKNVCWGCSIQNTWVCCWVCKVTTAAVYKEWDRDGIRNWTEYSSRRLIIIYLSWLLWPQRVWYMEVHEEYVAWMVKLLIAIVCMVWGHTGPQLVDIKQHGSSVYVGMVVVI